MQTDDGKRKWQARPKRGRRDTERTCANCGASEYGLFDDDGRVTCMMRPAARPLKTETCKEWL